MARRLKSVEALPEARLGDLLPGLADAAGAGFESDPDSVLDRAPDRDRETENASLPDDAPRR